MRLNRNKKTRIIALILFVIIMLTAYYIVLTISIDTQNRDILRVFETNYSNENIIRESINSTDRAIFLMPWNENLRTNRIMLLIKIKEYHRALKAIEDDLLINENGVNFGRKGIVYEYIGDVNKANDCYKKAINIFEEELIKSPNDDFLLAEISALSMVVGDTIRAQELCKKRVVGQDSTIINFIDRNNKLILNYKTGGMRYFIEKASRN